MFHIVVDLRIVVLVVVATEPGAALFAGRLNDVLVAGHRVEQAEPES